MPKSDPVVQMNRRLGSRMKCHVSRFFYLTPATCHVIFPNDTDASKCVSSFFLVLTRFPRMWGRTPGAVCNQLSGKMLLPHHFGLTLSSLSLPAGPWCIFLIQTVQGLHKCPFVLPSLGACSFTVCIRPTRITVLVLSNLLFLLSSHDTAVFAAVSSGERFWIESLCSGFLS